MTIILTTKRKRSIDRLELKRSVFRLTLTDVNEDTAAQLVAETLIHLADEWATNPRGVADLLKRCQ